MPAIYINVFIIASKLCNKDNQLLFQSFLYSCSVLHYKSIGVILENTCKDLQSYFDVKNVWYTWLTYQQSSSMRR